jgi:hypothetical protein
MLTDESRTEVCAHVHAREFDGELVILDLEKGLYYGLDPLGTTMWVRMAAGQTVGEVAAEVLGEYDVDARVLLEDLLALGNEWIRLGLVQGKR